MIVAGDTTNQSHAPMKSMTSLFVSHGAPPYALQPGRAGQQLFDLGQTMVAPSAILAISPHWRTHNLRVMSTPMPDTMHDFGGFDPALYQLSYPAQGSPQWAQTVSDVLQLKKYEVELDNQRGFDHGVWVPMMHLYPHANVPIFQLSMPHGLNSKTAYELGQALKGLSDLGLLIIGSGSLTHNLYEFELDVTIEANYVKEFTHWIRTQVMAGNSTSLLNALAQAPHASRAHPSDDHFLPLLIALGEQQILNRCCCWMAA